MLVSSDAGAFGGYSASSITTNTGTLTCPFSVTSTGSYTIWMNVLGADATRDSFFVAIDGESDTTHIYDVAENQQPCTDQGAGSCHYESHWGEWWWNRLNDRSATCGDCTGVGTQRTVSLTAGPHTVIIRQRDAETKVGYIIWTTDPNYDPNQSPPPPTATPTPTNVASPSVTPTPTSTGTITAVPTSTRTPTPSERTCYPLIHCNHQAHRVAVPCGSVPKTCPW